MVKKIGEMGGCKVQVSVQKEQSVGEFFEGQVFRLKLPLLKILTVF